VLVVAELEPKADVPAVGHLPGFEVRASTRAAGDGARPGDVADRHRQLVALVELDCDHRRVRVDAGRFLVGLQRPLAGRVALHRLAVELRERRA
jgi:hypothetical protein